MAAAKRSGAEGRLVEWPWDDRGRSAVTLADILRDIDAIRWDDQMRMAAVYGLVRF
jgi:hypothetical protein